MLPWIHKLARSSGPGPGSRVIGADLGARRIKIVMLGGSAENAEPVWAVDVPTPAGIFGPEGEFDSTAAGRVLAELLRGAPPGGAPSGALLLPSAALRVRRLKTDAVEQAVLARRLADDLELRVPGIPVEAVYHAVCPLGDTPAASRGDAARVLVAAAARRDVIRAYTAAGTAAGLRSLRLAAPAAALASVHAYLHPEEVDRAVLLLHVGSARSELVVVHGGAPLLALTVVQGTDQLFARLRAEQRGPDADALLREASDATLAVLEEWVGRLCGSHRTAVGAAERYLGHTLDALPVRISGGIARYRAVAERLAEAVPAPVASLDPGSRFPVPRDHDAGPALVLAIGAALEARAARQPLDARTGRLIPVMLDLRVPEPRTGAAAGRDLAVALVRDAAVWAAFLVAVVLAVGVPMVLEDRLRVTEAELERGWEAFQREAQQVAADSAKVSTLRADSARLAGTLGTLAALEAHRYGWPRLMHAAASLLPTYAWLEGMEMEPGVPGEPVRFRIRGIAPAQADVSRYERAIGGAPGVVAVVLEGSESLQAGPFALVGFQLSGAYAAPGSDGDQPRPGGAGYHGGGSHEVPSPTTP